MALHICFDPVRAICLLFVELFLKLFPRDLNSKPFADKWQHAPWRIGKVGLCSASPCDKPVVCLAQHVNQCAKVAFDSTLFLTWTVVHLRVTKVPNVRLIHTVHWSKTLESAGGKILASWKMFFFKAENFTTLLCASTKMVNCSVLMRMPVHLLSCSRSRFFSVVLYLVRRPILCYSLGGWLSSTHNSFQLAHAISLRWYSVRQRFRESRHELSIVVNVILYTGN